MSEDSKEPEKKKAAKKSAAAKPKKEVKKEKHKEEHHEVKKDAPHEAEHSKVPEHSQIKEIHPHLKEDKQSFFDKYLNYIILALIIILLVNVGYIYFVNKGIFSATSMDKPAEIEIIHIKATDCDVCFDVGPMIDAVSQMGVTVTKNASYEFYEKEAINLIKKLKIQKVPTFIITGDLEKAGLDQIGNITNDHIVFTQLQPPYLDVMSGEIIGKVTVTLIKVSDCADCYDIESLLPQMSILGVYIDETSIVEADSEEGEALIETYNIQKLPTMILSEQAGAYSVLTEAWGTVGAVADDGRFVLTEVPPPYLDVETGKVEGYVTVTFLSDKTCKECYDVKMHQQILQGLGINVAKEIDVDISLPQGIRLVKKYNITKVPTVILSEEAGIYQGVVQVWPQVGSVEEDGVRIFRNIAALAGSQYRNLETGEIEGGLPEAVGETTKEESSEEEESEEVTESEEEEAPRKSVTVISPDDKTED